MPAHAQHVAVLALQLFDQMKEVHQCGEYERKLVEFSALLHDVGWSISGKKHHKHTMRLINNARFRHISDKDKKLIAQIARYHRKSPPNIKHAEFMLLPREGQMLVKKLAPFVRLADALDRSHSGRIKDVHCEIDQYSCTFCVSHSKDLEEETQAIDRKKDMFEEVYHKEVRFKNLYYQTDKSKNLVIAAS